MKTPHVLSYQRASSDVPAAVAYLRISDDRVGAGLGVERQGEDCDALAKRLGLPKPTPFADNDLSAYSRRGKPARREQYDLMIEYLRTHRGCTIITWHTDRLHRTPRELEDFIDVVEAGGHTVETVQGGPIDLSTPMGRLVARQLCAIARYESEHKGERIKRKHLEIAQKGQPSGGGTRPYGYETDQVTIRESEAALVRYAYEQIEAGASLRAVARDMNEQGHRTARGALWSSSSLGRMLRRPRYAGLREHMGTTYAAVWDGIVSRELWEQVVAVLDAGGERWNPTPQQGTARYLLSGIVVCGLDGCGTRLVTHWSPSRKRGYRCPKANPVGCGKVRVQAEGIEQMVSLYAVKRLSDRRVLQGLMARETSLESKTAELVAAIEADERRLTRLTAAMAGEDGDEDELPEVIAAARKVRGRLAESRQRLATVAGRPVLGEVDPDTIAEDWKGMTVRGETDRQRALIRAVVEQVSVGPALVIGFNQFDPRRVDILPR